MILPRPSSAVYGCLLAFGLVVLCGATSSRAEVKTETVKYKSGDTEFVSFLAYDPANTGRRPGILVAPEWVGLNDYAKHRAEQLAGLGYVALAVDPYGGGKTTTDMKEAAAWSSALKKDPKELRARMNAALETLRMNPHVDPTKMAAIGYCFGGTAVLELARSGADLTGVVTFHGGLSTPAPAVAGAIKPQVLVNHGGDDPFVPMEDVLAFQKEMKDAGAHYQINIYSGAVHSFTNPAADGRRMKGATYNKVADERSWQAMQDFFKDIFSAPKKG